MIAVIIGIAVNVTVSIAVEIIIGIAVNVTVYITIAFGLGKISIELGDC